MEDYKELFSEAMTQIPKGAFLVANDNVMTIGWCQFGVVWGKPVCTVFVRLSRFTHDVLDHADRFTVSVPKIGEMAKELGYCASHSGRDTDKFKEGGISRIDSRTDAPAGVSGCSMHFECRILSRTEMDLSRTDPDVKARYYGSNQARSDGDPHTVLFGEILAAYRE
ncbi:MAG: flavin reductase family protein [Clostridia bacterium]|nr:flavin reductase family protein [Clostridia bacterium]